MNKLIDKNVVECIRTTGKTNHVGSYGYARWSALQGLSGVICRSIGWNSF